MGQVELLPEAGRISKTGGTGRDGPVPPGRAITSQTGIGSAGLKQSDGKQEQRSPDVQKWEDRNH